MPSHAVWSLWAMSGLRNYANISPMNVAMALMSPAERRLSMVRSICASRATATAALTVPQTDARNACSKLNVARTSPRAITRKHASHAVKGAATKAAPPARVDGLEPLMPTVTPRGRTPCFWERPSPRAARPERSLPRGDHVSKPRRAYGVDQQSGAIAVRVRAGTAFTLMRKLRRPRCGRQGWCRLKDTWAHTTTPHGRLMLTVLGGLGRIRA